MKKTQKPVSKPKRSPTSERSGPKSQSNRPERDGPRPARPERDSARSQRSERPERDGPRPQRGERPRPGRAERDAPKPPRAERESIRADRPEREAKPQRADRPEREAKPQRADRDGPGKPRRSHQTGREGLFLNNYSALQEYLRSQPQSLGKIFCAPREIKRLAQLLSEHKVTVSLEEDAEMESGFLASVKVRYMDEEKLLGEASVRTDDLIIACDHVTDTRNLGAIARTAAFFGLSTLIIPKDRQAPITTATLGTAQGAFATVTPCEVTNLGRTLMALKDCGYWIASADMVGTSVDQLPTRYEKLVLVLGSEDKGVSAQILNKSDFNLAIPSYGGKLESLNVSVAAGILIHALRAQSAQGKILPQG